MTADKIPPKKFDLEQSDSILIEYAQPHSMIDNGNLFFAATEYQGAYNELLKANTKLLADRDSLLKASTESFDQFWSRRRTITKSWELKDEYNRHMVTWFHAWTKPSEVEVLKLRLSNLMGGLAEAMNHCGWSLAQEGFKEARNCVSSAKQALQSALTRDKELAK